MEAFSISCTTCGRRLRVRDPGLIGQILACPKCRGMVLIAPPLDTAQSPDADAAGSPAAASESQLAVGDGPVDSEAVTREAIETQLPPLREGSAGAAWESAPGPPGTPAAGPSLSGSPPLGLPTDDEGPAAGPAPGPLPGPVQWQSESSARARQIGGIALLAFVSLLVSAGIFGYVVRQWQASRAIFGEPQAGAVDPADQPPATGTDPIEAATSAEDGEPPASIGESADAAQAAAPDAVTLPDTVTPPDTSGAATAAEEAQATDPTLDEVPLVGDGSTVDSQAERVPSADAAPSAESGVDATPAEGSGVPLPAAVPTAPDLFPAAAKADGEVPNIEELPAGLQQYMPLIELANAGEVPVKNPLPAPPTMEDLRIAAPDKAIPESEYPPAAEPVDVRMRMNSRVLGIEVQDRPFDQVVRVLGQVGGVPIELDLRLLDIAGIAPDTPISLRIADQPAAIVLARAVEAAGCRMTLGEDGIVRVGPQDEALQGGLKKALALDEFAGPLPIDPETLQRLIGDVGAPVKVGAEPVENAWAIEGPVEARVRAALFMEGLRKARGMAPQLASERTSRWLFEVVSDGTEVDWQPIPEQPVRLDFDRPRALDMIVGAVARERDAAAVLDWDSAWSHGLTPEATALPWLRERTAAQVLRETLEPFGLEAFVAGQGVWWVGTRDTYERAEVVAVLPTSLENADETARAELLRRVALAAGQESPEQVPAFVDPASGNLIVRLPRYVVRKLPAVLADTELALLDR